VLRTRAKQIYLDWKQRLDQNFHRLTNLQGLRNSFGFVPMNCSKEDEALTGFKQRH